MDILFVLLGISIYLAAAAIFALDYYKTDQRLAVVSAFAPPVAWFLYRKDWEKGELPAYAQLVSVGLVIAGIILISLFSKPEASASQKRYYADFYGKYLNSREALTDAVSAEKSSSTLNGRIHGSQFTYQNAEYDADGVLRISQGKEFYPELEISIYLNKIPQKQDEAWTKIVRPKDTNAPVVYISWIDPDSPVPKSQKFSSGYSMDLTLEHDEFNQFAASLNLVLPDHENSFVVGSFIAYSSRVRYDDDGLSRYHDSQETIEYIASENLKNTYRKYVKGIYGFRNTDISYRSGSAVATTTAFLNMESGIKKQLQLRFFKNENGWFPDVKGLKAKLRDDAGQVSAIPGGLRSAQKFKSVFGHEVPDESDEVEDLDMMTAKPKAVTSAGVQLETNAKPNPAAATPAAAKPGAAPAKPAAQQVVAIEIISQEEQIPDLLKPFLGKDIKVTTNKGKVKTGEYIRIQRKQVVVEIQLGTGVIEYLTTYENLKSIEVMNSPQVSPQKFTFYRKTD